MSSAFHLMKSGVKHMGPAAGMAGVAGLVLDTGAEYGAGYALGQIYVKHGDKAWGKKAPYVAAAAGKGVALLAALMGHGGMASHLVGGVANAVGSVGVGALGLQHGLTSARKSLGVKVVALPANAALPAGGRDITTIGALGQAAPGRGLSWDQIEELASMR